MPDTSDLDVYGNALSCTCADGYAITTSTCSDGALQSGACSGIVLGWGWGWGSVVLCWIGVGVGVGLVYDSTTSNLDCYGNALCCTCAGRCIITFATCSGGALQSGAGSGTVQMHSTLEVHLKMMRLGTRGALYTSLENFCSRKN